MALNNLGLGFVFTARDRATQTIQRVGGAFDRQAARARLASGIIQAAAIGVGASLATMATGIAGLRGAMALANISGEFGEGLARVRAITRATTGELGNLREAAIRAGIATQFSPTEAVQGLGELGVRGFQAQESISALSGVLDFAAGGAIGVAESAQTVGSALRVFGLEAGQATLAADRLLRISNITALQANELALALGNVSRGAGLTEQNMNEMLIAMGLVRNTGVQASVAASGVSSALIFMTRNAQEIRRTLGVEVTEALEDGTTRMRNFMDVILEASEAAGTRYADAAERGAVFSRLFGRFGLVAATAVGRQLRQGVRNASGEIVRGAEAMEYLRGTMEGAAGTAAEFRDIMLDTFAGQQRLLQGTIQTLQVVFGDAFARVIRPFVTALTDTLNAVIRFWTALPEPLQTSVAAIAMAITGMIAAFGGLGTIGFIVALTIPFLETMAITMGVVLLATMPVVGAVASLAAGIVALGVSVRRNVGGLGDFFQRAVGRARLAYRSLRELFSQGGFSKAVSEELGRAENRGLRRFVINVFALVTRLRRTLTAVGRGFREALSAGAPAGKALVRALRELGRALGIVGDGLDDAAGTPMQRFLKHGVEIGRSVGRSVVVVIDVVRQVVQFLTGVVKRFQARSGDLRRAWGFLAESIAQVSQALRAAFGYQEDVASSGRRGASAAEDFGRVFADVVVPSLVLAAHAIGTILRAIGLYVRAVTWLQRTFAAAFGGMNSAVNSAIGAWWRLKQQVGSVVAFITSRVAGMLSVIPAPVRGALGLGGVVRYGQAQAEGMATRTASTALKARRRGGSVAPGPSAQPAVVAARAAAGRPAAAPESSATREATSMLREAVGALRAAASQPITVQVGAETIARAARAGARTIGAGSFLPVGVGEE